MSRPQTDSQFITGQQPYSMPPPGYPTVPPPAGVAYVVPSGTAPTQFYAAPQTSVSYTPPPGYPYQPAPAGYGPPAGYSVQPPPATAVGGKPPSYAPPTTFAPSNFDVESQQTAHQAAQKAEYAVAFADQQIRRGFIRKVLSIVAFQLLLTVGVCCVFYFVAPLKDYVKSQGWPFYLAWGLSFAMLIVLICVPKLGRKYPVNYIFLLLFTACFAFLVGAITSWFDSRTVLIAFGCTAAAVTAIMLMAFFLPFDITSAYMYIGIASIVFITALLVGLFWDNQVYHLVISCIAAVLFSVYLIFDLQRMMHGKAVQISPDEYVFAALSIYLDVVNIFLAILSIAGFASR